MKLKSIRRTLGIRLSRMEGKFLKRRIVSEMRGGNIKLKISMNVPKKTTYAINVPIVLGILYFSKSVTKGFNALIIMNAIKRENISSLTAHIKFKSRRNNTVNTIVFDDISIFCIKKLYPFVS